MSKEEEPQDRRGFYDDVIIISPESEESRAIQRFLGQYTSSLTTLISWCSTRGRLRDYRPQHLFSLDRDISISTNNVLNRDWATPFQIDKKGLSLYRVHEVFYDPAQDIKGWMFYADIDSLPLKALVLDGQISETHWKGMTSNEKKKLVTIMKNDYFNLRRDKSEQVTSLFGVIEQGISGRYTLQELYEVKADLPFNPR